ncbi:CDP-alcohol phosphatidyltransferase family protein [Actinocatenispora sera]|uniref:CDP-alcohol phosphatidyltransferase family protein n=1 Tax=Actinocatenispora sera TaxID=390989 RepID=UPI003403DE76
MTPGNSEPAPDTTRWSDPTGPVVAVVVLAAEPSPAYRPVEATPVGGRPLLDRTVRILHAAGVRRVLVAAGRRSGDLVAGLVTRHAPPAEPCPPPADLPPGRYLLVGAAAVFDAETVRDLAERTGVRCTDTTLAVVDAGTAREVLAADATDAALDAVAGLVLRPAAGFATTLGGDRDVRRVHRALWHRYGSKPSDGLVCRYLNRPLSRPVTLLLARTGVWPDLLSGLSFAVAVTGAAVIGFGGRWWTMLLGGVLVQAGNALDGVDGEVARIGLRTSRRGALLDTILDRYADLAVIAGLVLAAGGRPVDWAFGFVAGAGSLLVSYINVLAPGAPQRLLRRDVRLLLCAVAAAVSAPLAGLAALAVLVNADAARVFALVLRRAPGSR